MADEIRIATELSVANGTLNVSQSANVNATQTTPGAVQRQQTISTAGSTITLTGVITPRIIQCINLDATNYVEIGPDSSGALVSIVRLLAGESCLMPLRPGVVIKALANTGNVDVALTVVET